MSLADDIRDRAVRLLERKDDLRNFQVWLTSETWDVHLSGDAEAERLTYDIERVLSELTSGHRTEEEFRAFLVRLFEGSWSRSLAYHQDPLKPHEVPTDLEKPPGVTISVDGDDWLEMGGGDAAHG